MTEANPSDRADDTYTHGHHDAVLRSHRWRTADNSAAYLLDHLTSGMRLLDVGCGPGTLTVDLATRVAPGEVIGIDVASEAIDEATRHAQSVPDTTNVSFVVGDFRDADLGDPFDVVHAHQVLQHLRDPVGALQAMAELTKPGGLVAARDSDYSAMTWWPANSALDRWLALYLEVTRRNGAEANAGRWLLHWARGAGFADVTYSTSAWTFWTDADRAWWGSLWADRVVSSRLAEQAISYGLATTTELADIAAGWRAWAAERDAVLVVPHGEIVVRI